MVVSTQLRVCDILFFNLGVNIIFDCCLFREFFLIAAYSDSRHHAMVEAVIWKRHTLETQAGGHEENLFVYSFFGMSCTMA